MMVCWQLLVHWARVPPYHGPGRRGDLNMLSHLRQPEPEGYFDRKLSILLSYFSIMKVSKMALIN